MNHFPVNTVIIEDHPLFAQGLSLILRDMPHLHLLKIVNSYQEMTHLLRQHRIDLILLDIKLKDENGTEICLLIKEQYPGTKIILISMFDPNSLTAEIKTCK